jgi:hypothetical protein
VKRSDTVDSRIKNLWAILASKVAVRAANSAAVGDLDDAEGYAERVAEWLDKAGARATSNYYRQPQ